jgi:hypothetical protein
MNFMSLKHAFAESVLGVVVLVEVKLEGLESWPRTQSKAWQQLLANVCIVVPLI